MTGLAAPRRALLVPALVLVVAAALVLWLAPRGPARADSHEHGEMAAASSAHPATITPRNAAQLALHDQMRHLWEDHVAWTRLAIVTFAAESPSFGDTAQRLLNNQAQIGDAVATYYGRAAGDRLTALLQDHITIAVELLQAAKAADSAAFDDAHVRWHANAADIAAFLSAANPESWPEDVVRDAMDMHLEQTLAEAAHELGGDYAASVADYDEISAHILGMADLLSSGIIRAFPNRFH